MKEKPSRGIQRGLLPAAVRATATARATVSPVAAQPGRLPLQAFSDCQGSASHLLPNPNISETCFLVFSLYLFVSTDF